MQRGLRSCKCNEHDNNKSVLPKLIAITGGPGSGKTALLELARQEILCQHCVVLPESATIAFKGGFPRLKDNENAQKAAQRVIFHIQKELETLALKLDSVALILCDRGTPDNLAYWPNNSLKEWEIELNTTIKNEISRYFAVIHLEPPIGEGYVNNELRKETAFDARLIDSRIIRSWNKHEKYFLIKSRGDFLSKAKEGLRIISSLAPECCQIKFSSL